MKEPDPKGIRRIERKVGRAVGGEHPLNIGPALATFLANFAENLVETPDDQMECIGVICKEAIDLIAKRNL